MNRPRKHNESYEQYKKNLKAESKARRVKAQGKVVWHPSWGPANHKQVLGDK